MTHRGRVEVRQPGAILMVRRPTGRGRPRRVGRVLPQPRPQLGNLSPQRLNHFPQLRILQQQRRVLRGKLLRRRDLGRHNTMINGFHAKINKPRRRPDYQVWRRPAD